MIPGSIRARLLLVLLAVAAIAGVVVVAGMAVVLRTEHDFRRLATEDIPRVALAGELAEFTGTLAALAVRIVAAEAADAAALAGSVAGPAQGIAAVLDSPLLRDTAAARALGGAEADLRAALVDVIETGAAFAALAADEAEAESQLRWTHTDVQDQAQALLMDLSFNIDEGFAVLSHDPGGERRAAAEEAVKRERLLRDRLQRLAAETATLTALLLQARGAETTEALDRVERLGRDTLDAIALNRLPPSSRLDATLLMQDIDRLTALAAPQAGFFDQARRRLTLRSEAVWALGRAQAALAAMQAALSDLGRAERSAAQAAADAAAARVFNGAVALAIATLLGVGATVAILLMFVRNGVLRPIEALSGDLSRIARGETGEPVQVRGRSEIAEMAKAVEVFRASVKDLHSTHRALSQEVSERRRAVERLELTQRELVQAGKMAALGQMSAAISHEINQPLAAMRHMLHALERKHPDALPGLSRIGAMIDRIAATIGHLRRISRRADHRSVRVRLSEPLEAALALLDHRLRSEGVTVAVADTVAGLVVQGDDILLEQMLLNVLGNALDAIGETGRGSGQITVDLLDGPDPVLRIADDGVGLGGRSGADLIDPFFTTKEVGKGLGLGLSIAFNVIQDMGGHLEIGSGADGGAVVAIRLRRWQESVTADA